MSKFSQKLFLLILVAAILIGLIALALNYSKISKKTLTQTPSTAQNTPLTPHPEPRFANIATVEGTISAVLKESISIRTNSGVKTYSLDQLLDVGKPSATQSGKLVKGMLSDLRLGQKVSITALKDSNSARIIIIKL